MAEYGSILGYPVVITENMVEAVQARKHKKKRINKKWLKRYGKKYVPSDKIIVVDRMIYVHPKTFAKLKELVGGDGNEP